MDIGQIITLIAGVGGLITGVYAVRKTNAESEKYEAEAADIIQRAAGALVEKQEARIAALEIQVGILTTALEARDRRIQDLECQVKERDGRISDMQTEIDTLSERLGIVEKKRQNPTRPV